MVVTGRLVVESRRVEVGVSPIKVMTTILAGQAVGGPTLAVMILTTSHPGSALCCASHQFLRGCAQFDVQCMWSSTQHTCIELQCNAILIFQARRASLIRMGCTDQPTTISWGALTNQLRFSFFWPFAHAPRRHHSELLVAPLAVVHLALAPLDPPACWQLQCVYATVV
jgi:hypothetical protein